MRRVTLLVALALTCSAGQLGAQLSIPTMRSQPVVDPTMVVEDRGQKLEIFPTVRATPQLASSGQFATHRLRASTADSVLGPRSLGVVYNHTIGAQGFITGEITFQPTTAELPADLQPDAWPGLKKIVEPNVYELVGRTPSEVLDLFSKLKTRTDLRWVELFVNYGASADSVYHVLEATKKKASTGQREN